MLKDKLARVVYLCTRHAWAVIAVSALVAVLAGIYVARHFAIDTDINKLISADLPWRQQELAFARAFPQRYGTIFAVVDAPTAEQASQASAALTRRLAADKSLFVSVNEPGASPLFTRNGRWLEEESIREEGTAAAIKAVIAHQLAREMKRRRITKKRMAELMKTSRAQVDRLLDPKNGSATIESLQRAARIVGRELRMEFV
jgi:antitoxin HicB